MQLLQRFLTTLRFAADGRICYGILPAGSYEATGTTAEDTEGLVDYARCIDGVDIGASCCRCWLLPPRRLNGVIFVVIRRRILLRRLKM